MTRHLVWTTHREGERLIIHLESLRDPTTGPRPPEPEELAGLCFSVPPAGEVILRLADRDLVPRVFGPIIPGNGWWDCCRRRHPLLEALEP